MASRLMCPHCGWKYEPGEGEYELVPYHSVRGYDTAMTCPGSKQHPRNPESDRRPLWMELPKEQRDAMPSQVRTVGRPAPRTWDQYEAGCLATFGGGYQDAAQIGAFQHGMRTVFNLLRTEFPPAEVCQAAADLLAACVAAVDPDPCELDHHGNCQAHGLGNPCEQRLIRAAVRRATEG